MSPSIVGEGDARAERGRVGPGPAPRPLDDLGVVIPTLDEALHLPALLDDLGKLVPPDRIVVVDGGSSDGTRELASRYGVRAVTARRGRGTQMNAGAERISAEWILFLHADCRCPAATRFALLTWLRTSPRSQAAHFRFALREPRWYRPLLEWGQRARERLSGLAYGDQGLLISRSRFDEVGGFPELPLMEDVEMIRKLRSRGGIDRIDAPLPTSTRRYDGTGPIRGWVRNACLMGFYLGGVSPTRLARFYEHGRT